MLAPENNILGCPVNIPETVLFQNQRPGKVIKQLDDGCLAVVRQGMNFMDLRTHLINISTERTKEHTRRL